MFEFIDYTYYRISRIDRGYYYGTRFSAKLILSLLGMLHSYVVWSILFLLFNRYYYLNPSSLMLMSLPAFIVFYFIRYRGLNRYSDLDKKYSGEANKKRKRGTIKIMLLFIISFVIFVGIGLIVQSGN